MKNGPAVLCDFIELTGFSGADGALDLVWQEADFRCGEGGAQRLFGFIALAPGEQDLTGGDAFDDVPLRGNRGRVGQAGVEEPHGVCGAASVDQAA